MKIIFIIISLSIISFNCKKELPTEESIDDSNGENNLFIDTIYAGGSFLLIENLTANNIAMWDGKNWHPLDKGIIGKNADVECMAFYKEDLYVGGFIDSAGEVAANHIAKWNGKEWSSVGSGIDGRVTSLVEYKGDLYAGGWFFTAGGINAGNIAKWNGSEWSSVGEGLSDEVYTLCVYNDELYAGGWFTKNYQGYFNANNIARWNGSEWDTVESGVNSGSWIMTLTVFNNELLATGNFSKCGNIEVSNIAKWNNNIWQSVNNITLSNRTYSSAIYKNEFHIAGESDSNESDSHSYYAIWNGIAWSFNNFLFDGLPGCLYSSDNYLYVGGKFNIVNGKEAKGIFKWDGNSIQNLGSGVQGYISSILSK